MKITFLGTSSLLGDGYSSNILLDLGISGSLLVDCGFDIKHSLKKAGRRVEDINNIYISHLHSDHVGGLEYIGFYNYFILKRRITVYIHESYLDDLWNILKPSMQKVDNGIKNISDYFDIRPLKNYNYFMVGQYIFGMIKNKHIANDNGSVFSYGLVMDRSYSYEFNKERQDIKKIYISTDTVNTLVSERWPENIIEKVNSCDLIFHEVDFNDNSSCHSSYKKLCNLPNDIKGKMWLYHYESKIQSEEKVKENGFAGIVEQGQIFNFGKDYNENF